MYVRSFIRIRSSIQTRVLYVSDTSDAIKIVDLLKKNNNNKTLIHRVGYYAYCSMKMIHDNDDGFLNDREKQLYRDRPRNAQWFR